MIRTSSSTSSTEHERGSSSGVAKPGGVLRSGFVPSAAIASLHVGRGTGDFLRLLAPLVEPGEAVGIDREGKPLADPKRAEEGMLLPLGGMEAGYKGYGLAMVIGLLAGTLGGCCDGPRRHRLQP